MTEQEEILKDVMHEEVVIQLYNALLPLKELIGEAKFEKRIKKATKILCKGIKSLPKISPVVVVPLPLIKVAENNVPAKKITNTKAPAKKTVGAVPAKKVKKTAPAKKQKLK